MYDCLLEDYQLVSLIRANLWSFCEQAQTIYTLKESASVLCRGGAHYTTHPLSDEIKESNHNDHLNQVLLPQLLQRFWEEFSYMNEQS